MRLPFTHRDPCLEDKAVDILPAIRPAVPSGRTITAVTVRVEGLGDWDGAAQPPTGKYYPSTIIAHCLDFRTKNF